MGFPIVEMVAQEGVRPGQMIGADGRVVRTTPSTTTHNAVD
jgi:hypothetical protein